MGDTREEPAAGHFRAKGGGEPASYRDEGKEDLQRDRERIERLTDSWPSRACVRKAGPDLTVDYDPGKPDFLTELLPFHDHPIYQNAPEEFK